MCARLRRLFCFSVLVLAVLVACPIYANPVYFVIAESAAQQTHGDSFVLPLLQASAIAHARDLIQKGPEQAGAPIVVASISPGSNGINRDILASSQPEWSWHVTSFESFADFGIEILDGWPGYVEEDVPGWIDNSNGRIGFWNYTVVSELQASPNPGMTLPLTGMLPASATMLAGVIITTTTVAIRRRTHPR